MITFTSFKTGHFYHNWDIYINFEASKEEFHTSIFDLLVVLGLIFNQVALAMEGSTVSGSLQRRKKSKRKWKRLWFLLKDKVLYTFTAREVRGHRVSHTSPKTLMVIRNPFLAVLSIFFAFRLWGEVTFLLFHFSVTQHCVRLTKGILCALSATFSVFCKPVFLAVNLHKSADDKLLNFVCIVQDKVASESLPLQGFTVKLSEQPEGEESSSVFQLYHKKTLYYTFRADDHHTARR